MKPMTRLSLGCAGLALALAAQPVAAQTVIVPDTAPSRTTGTNVTTNGSDTVIWGGTRMGDNLFHSFARFSLAFGDSATWTAVDAATIRAVINRVTGGDVSLIDGELNSLGLPNADFYFINPAGIIFGSGAALNVPAAAYFSTAANLRFADGTRFMALTPDGSSLSMAAPEAFGFVGTQGDIVMSDVSAARMALTNSEFILAGANVTIERSSFSSADLGLFAVGDGTSIDIALRGGMPADALGGRLRIERSTINQLRTAEIAGNIRLAAGTYEQIDASVNTIAPLREAGDVWLDAADVRISGQLGSTSRSGFDGGSVNISAGNLDLLAGGSIVTFTSGGGDAGDISIDATGAVSLAQGSEIASRVLHSATSGSAGDIALSARSLSLADSVAGNSDPSARIVTVVQGGVGSVGQISLDIAEGMYLGRDTLLRASSGAGAAGSNGAIDIAATDLDINGGTIEAMTQTAQAGGSIGIDLSGRLLMRNGGMIATIAQAGGGAAGDIGIAAGSLDIQSGSGVMSWTRTSGDAGSIDLQIAGDALVNGNGSQISSNTRSAGDSGRVSMLVGGDLTVSDRGAIAASTSGSGDGGEIAVDVTGNLTVASNGTINTSSLAFNSGAAGSLEVHAANVMVEGRGTIESNTHSGSDAGTVFVTADGLVSATSDGRISSSTFFRGDAGAVWVRAQEIDVREGGGITSLTVASGDAGLVDIVASDQVTVGTGGVITARAGRGATTGNAGDVRITARSLVMEDLDTSLNRRPADIASSVEGAGQGGSVDIAVTDSVYIGTDALISAEATARATGGNAGSISIRAGSLDINGGRIRSLTSSPGNAGEVHLAVDGLLSVRNSGSITTASNAADSGLAGLIDIAAGSLEVTSGGQIVSSTNSGSSAGQVRIETDGNLLVNGEGSAISSLTNAAGNAGEVDVIVGEDLTVANRGSISASTQGAGRGGLVFVDVTGDLLVTSRGSISSSSLTQDSGAAGSLDISAANVFVTLSGAIESNTVSSNDAGEVAVRASGMVSADLGGRISSSTSAGGNAGSVSVFAQDMDLRDGGGITSLTTAAGNAGSVNVEVGNLLTVGSGGVITARAGRGATTGNAGDVRIRARSLVMEARDVASGRRAPDIASSVEGAGEGGTVDIRVTENMYVGTDALITAEVTSRATGGNAGSIFIEAGSLDIDGGRIRSLTSSPGDAGAVFIDVADTMRVRNGGSVTTASQTSDSGQAGLIWIEAGSLAVTEGGFIVSSTVSDADAGEVRILTDGDLLVDGEFSTISTRTDSAGNAGQIDIRSGGNVTVSNLGSIAAATAGTGTAGEIGIAAQGDLLVTGGGRISTSSEAADSGEAGSLDIRAANLWVSDTGRIESSTSSSADAGAIGIEVAGMVGLSSGGSISTSSFAAGNAGNLLIAAGQLDVNSGRIASETSGTGDAGRIEIAVADMMQVRGGGTISTASLDAASGTAGLIDIAAGSLRVTDAGQITSSTNSAADAGSISIVAQDSVFLAGSRSTIATETRSGGDAGDVAVVSQGGTIRLTANSRISADTFGSGDGGSVFLGGPNILIDQNASASTSAAQGSTGRSGEVVVDAGSLTLLTGGSLSTTSFNALTAGQLRVWADEILVDGPGSEITSANLADLGGGAGLVAIAAEFVTLSDGGQITTNAVSGPAGDINIAMPRTGILRLLGDGRAGQITTSSGTNTGGVIRIANPFLILSDGGSILALGEQGGANVRIDTQVFINSADNINLLSVDGQLDVNSGIEDVASGVLLQDLSFLDASGVLRQACRTGDGEASELLIRPSGPYVTGQTTDPQTALPGESTLACR